MKFVKRTGWSRSILVLICVAIAAVVLTTTPREQVFADSDELAAVYRNGLLEVNVPFDEGVSHNRALSLEVIDANDKLVAQVVRSVSPSETRGARVTIPLDRSVALEDLAWDRLRINAGDSSKIVSLS